MKQRNGAVEFCIGSYLADKHTHVEAPMRVKKPYIGVGSIVGRREGEYERGVMRVKWMERREERERIRWSKGRRRVIKETNIV